MERLCRQYSLFLKYLITFSTLKLTFLLRHIEANFLDIGADEWSVSLSDCFTVMGVKSQ
jgi:hypothetical protein